MLPHNLIHRPQHKTAEEVFLQDVRQSQVSDAVRKVLEASFAKYSKKLASADGSCEEPRSFLQFCFRIERRKNKKWRAQQMEIYDNGIVQFLEVATKPLSSLRNVFGGGSNKDAAAEYATADTKSATGDFDECTDQIDLRKVVKVADSARHSDTLELFVENRFRLGSLHAESKHKLRVVAEMSDGCVSGIRACASPSESLRKCREICMFYAQKNQSVRSMQKIESARAHERGFSLSASVSVYDPTDDDHSGAADDSVDQHSHISVGDLQRERLCMKECPQSYLPARFAHPNFRKCGKLLKILTYNFKHQLPVTNETLDSAIQVTTLIREDCLVYVSNYYRVFPDLTTQLHFENCLDLIQECLNFEDFFSDSRHRLSQGDISSLKRRFTRKRKLKRLKSRQQKDGSSNGDDSGSASQRSKDDLQWALMSSSLTGLRRLQGTKHNRAALAADATTTDVHDEFEMQVTAAMRTALNNSMTDKLASIADEIGELRTTKSHMIADMTTSSHSTTLSAPSDAAARISGSPRYSLPSLSSGTRDDDALTRQRTLTPSSMTYDEDSTLSTSEEHTSSVVSVGRSFRDFMSHAVSHQQALVCDATEAMAASESVAALVARKALEETKAKYIFACASIKNACLFLTEMREKNDTLFADTLNKFFFVFDDDGRSDDAAASADARGRGGSRRRRGGSNQQQSDAAVSLKRKKSRASSIVAKSRSEDWSKIHLTLDRPVASATAAHRRGSMPHSAWMNSIVADGVAQPLIDYLSELCGQTRIMVETLSEIARRSDRKARKAERARLRQTHGYLGAWVSTKMLGGASECSPAQEGAAVPDVDGMAKIREYLQMIEEVFEYLLEFCTPDCFHSDSVAARVSMCAPQRAATAQPLCTKQAFLPVGSSPPRSLRGTQDDGGRDSAPCLQRSNTDLSLYRDDGVLFANDSFLMAKMRGQAGKSTMTTRYGRAALSSYDGLDVPREAQTDDVLASSSARTTSDQALIHVEWIKARRQKIIEPFMDALIAQFVDHYFDEVHDIVASESWKPSKQQSHKRLEMQRKRRSFSKTFDSARKTNASFAASHTAATGLPFAQCSTAVIGLLDKALAFVLRRELTRTQLLQLSEMVTSILIGFVNLVSDLCQSEIRQLGFASDASLNRTLAVSVAAAKCDEQSNKGESFAASTGDTAASRKKSSKLSRMKLPWKRRASAKQANDSTASLEDLASSERDAKSARPMRNFREIIPEKIICKIGTILRFTQSYAVLQSQYTLEGRFYYATCTRDCRMRLGLLHTASATTTAEHDARPSAASSANQRVVRSLSMIEQLSEHHGGASKPPVSYCAQLQHAKFYDMCDSVLSDIAQVCGDQLSAEPVFLTLTALNAMVVSHGYMDAANDEMSVRLADIAHSLEERLQCVADLFGRLAADDDGDVKTTTARGWLQKEHVRLCLVALANGFFSGVEKMLLAERVKHVPNLGQVLFLKKVTLENRARFDARFATVYFESEAHRAREVAAKMRRRIPNSDWADSVAVLARIEALISLHFFNTDELCRIHGTLPAVLDERSRKVEQPWFVDGRRVEVMLESRALRNMDQRAKEFCKGMKAERFANKLDGLKRRFQGAVGFSGSRKSSASLDMEPPRADVDVSEEENKADDICAEKSDSSGEAKSGPATDEFSLEYCASESHIMGFFPFDLS